MYNSEEVKSVLNKKKQRNSWFLDDYTLNLYKGCSFNCLFCYVKGSIYGEHNERSVSYKENAISILDKQLSLRAKKGQYGYIVISSSTEPYSQMEEELKLTRSALEVILKHNFPVHIITRSDLILRDIDLLEQIQKSAILPNEYLGKLDGTIITFSFSTIHHEIAKIFEPGATPVTIRLQTMHSMIKKGFRCGVSLMPLLPYISDRGEMLEEYFKVFKDLGVAYIMPSTLTLFGNERGDSKQQVFRAVEKHFPDVLDKYHKFFLHSDYMPKYYNDAFMKRMKELTVKYRMPLRIVC